MSPSAPAPAVPRLTYLRIKNYRALRDVEFRDLTPFTVLIGPNGSGKSTVLDALDFLAEAVRGNLATLWGFWNGFEGLRTRGSDGNIEFKMEVFVNEQIPCLRYHIVIGEAFGFVFIVDEQLVSVKDEEERILFEMYGVATNTPHHTGANNFLRYNFYENWTGHARIVKPSDISFLFGNVISEDFDNPINEAIIKFNEFLLSYRCIHLTDKHLVGFSTKGPRGKACLEWR